MTFTANDSTFPTRRCVNVSRHYVITSTGCSSVTIDSTTLAALSSGSQFTISGLPKMPVTLKTNDTLGFDITFDPDATGTMRDTLGVFSHNGAFTRRIPLAAAINGTIPNARVAVIGSEMTRLLQSRPGIPVGIKVLAIDAIADTCNLQTISFDLHYNWNLLTGGNATPANGWSLLDNTEHDGGLLTMTLHHDVATSIPDSTVLAEIPFTTTLGDSTWTDIRLDNLRFNSDDANYARCVLSWSAISDSVHYTTIDTCGSPSERGMLNGIHLTGNVGLHPNPSAIMNGHAQSTMTMTLFADASVRVTVRDMLGRVFESQEYPLAKGEQSIALDLLQASEGAYFVTVEARTPTGIARATGKLLIQAQ
jgi:hypothetical protein